MSSFVNLFLHIGARGSQLSRAQVEEVIAELQVFHPHVTYEPVWIETVGDRDLGVSLRALEKTDFFTCEIDQRQLRGEFRLSIHSAKDLPDPLPQGLEIIALTKGVDPSDAIVLRDQDLPLGAKIGTSSLRREQNIRALRADLICADIRGSVDHRLRQLDEGHYDGVVIAEAALIRLGLTHRLRIPLPGETAAWQGQLAVVAREEDYEMQELFSCIDTRIR
jgi:hydroxymethylbilane synthase